jgi:FKBP-type peptidyl-prolyl cis-trans isomerase
VRFRAPLQRYQFIQGEGNQAQAGRTVSVPMKVHLERKVFDSSYPEIEFQIRSRSSVEGWDEGIQ